MSDCLVYWKDYWLEGREFNSDEPGPSNFHYHTRQKSLFKQINKGENLWVVVLASQSPLVKWSLVERISVRDKRIRPDFPRSYQVVGDPARSEFFEISEQSDLTPLLQKLNFLTGKRISAEGAKIAQFLQTIRPLASNNSASLYRYSQNLSRVRKLEHSF